MCHFDILAGYGFDHPSHPPTGTDADSGNSDERRELARILEFSLRCANADAQLRLNFAADLLASGIPMWAKLIAARVSIQDYRDREGYKDEWSAGL